MQNIFCTVNGKPTNLKYHPAGTLLDALRDQLHLTGSKECCGKGECGSCTVLLDGEMVCSCLVLAGQVENRHIVTVEGLGQKEHMTVVQEAFVEEGATQCGYCTPGFIVSASVFLKQIDHIPSTEEIKTALAGNLCRCTGYTKIIKAVQTAAARQRQAKGSA